MPRQESINKLDSLLELGYTHQQLLEHILYNFMSGAEANEAMDSCIAEFAPELEEEQ